MTDNPFEDLEELDEETEESEDQVAEDVQIQEERDQSAEVKDREQSWENTPGFPFEECDNRTFYARKDIMETLDDTIFDVEVILRQEHNLKDFKTREFYDALIRSADENKIADLIKQQRKPD
ncbi:hypothetical protein RH831_10930 [Halodesulfurarchaeum sp. HSR-GB]|uniref:hypothetical protein n=1 Tax=Halodesulfurarchaeum sp. HSR-GB TaxID=3074077 RepID=UPI00285838C0|nr:hypothetical protein [Halodesulfurarchaeum sp. HSR-GB]MDR5657689.1 hypothetical protein [Halodesulfurarchaeum sp. HSR-GB]